LVLEKDAVVKTKKIRGERCARRQPSKVERVRG